MNRIDPTLCTFTTESYLPPSTVHRSYFFTMKAFLFSLVVASSITNIIADCIVQTPSGTILGGEIVTESGERVKAYCGIPYAEPPVEGLRFQNPVPKKPWDGVLKADKEACECKKIIDGAVVGNEDCLYVNVYTPKVKGDSNVTYPVVVYIPDAASNCSNLLSGPQYLLDNRDLVYVCISYRVGVFGFLSTGDESASGNFGLKDQWLALEWVQNNIVSFHGDPNDVILLGHGSGSESVHLQSLSLKAEANLFKRVIYLSGIALCPRAFTDDPSYYQKPKELGKRVNCTSDNTKELVDCLRNVDGNLLIEESYEIFGVIDIATSTTWRPTKEPNVPGAFLNDTPANIIKQRLHKPPPAIVSHVTDEGTFFTKNLLKDEKLYELSVNNAVEVIEVLLGYYSLSKEINVTEVAIKAKEYYLGSVIPEEKAIVIERYTNLASDLFYTFPILQLLDHLGNLDFHPVYAIRFNYHGTITATENFNGSLGETGVGQGSELFSIFPIPPSILGSQYSDLKPSKQDQSISTIYINLGFSFALNDTIVSPALNPPDLWQPQNNGSQVFLEFGDGTSPAITLHNKYSCRVDFWFDNLPLYSLD